LLEFAFLENGAPLRKKHRGSVNKINEVKLPRQSKVYLPAKKDMPNTRRRFDRMDPSIW